MCKQQNTHDVIFALTSAARIHKISSSDFQNVWHCHFTVACKFHTAVDKGTGHVCSTTATSTITISFAVARSNGQQSVLPHVQPSKRQSVPVQCCMIVSPIQLPMGEQGMSVRRQPHPLLQPALHDLMVNSPSFLTSSLQNVSQFQCIVVGL